MHLSRGSKHGPPGIRALSARLSSKLTVWQTTVIVFLWLYICRNFAKIVDLECPEPLANLYSRSFFRASWITTALDAGFWTAMGVKPKWLRDIASLVFTVYYLFAAEQADEKVRRIRATLTVDHLRVSWNKLTTPYLWTLASLMRPRFTSYSPRRIRIPRPSQSTYKEPVAAWLYFDGPLSALQDQTRVILDIPGGGFVAMNPRTSEDKLLAWAGKTKLPILSLDYKKAPEYPYPYALNECYDVYHSIVATRGRCLGLSGHTLPRIVLAGDSAGGNLAVGTTLVVLQSQCDTNSRRWQGEDVLPRPDGLVLAYPALIVKVESWMTEEQMALILDRSVRKMNQKVVQEKEGQFNKLTPSTTPGPSDDALHDLPSGSGYFGQNQSRSMRKSPNAATGKAGFDSQTVTSVDNQPKQVQTRLAVSSVMAYTNDRILTPEMMRAMIILYIGPHNRPDFSTDFLLSPVLSPEALLARFPKTYFLTGERDPLVDDTVIFAGRLRQAKLRHFQERQELGLEKSQRIFQEKDHVEVSLIPAISHGFLQMVGLFPDAWKYVNRCANWIQDLFAIAEMKKYTKKKSIAGSTHRQSSRSDPAPRSKSKVRNQTPGPIKRSLTGESSADEDRPLEMGIGKMTSMSKDNPDRKSQDYRAKTTTEADAAHGDSESHSHITLKDFKNAQEIINPSSSATDVGNTVPTPTRSQQRRRGELMRSLKLSLRQEPREEEEGGRGANDSVDRDVAIDDDDDDDADADDRRDTSDLIQGAVMTGLRRREGSLVSLVSLPSEEDLLERRMHGLAGGLNGVWEGARTPGF